jgi:hypothetical protein
MQIHFSWPKVCSTCDEVLKNKKIRSSKITIMANATTMHFNFDMLKANDREKHCNINVNLW